jgi:stage II sporulation protein D
MVIFVLITSYMIQTQNDEEILILYLDYSTEFGIDLKNFHIHNNMKKIIINFITKNQIKFNGEKVFLSVGGILLAVMLLTENTSTYDEAKLTYVNQNIIPNLEISTLVDNTRNSLEINSIKVDSKKQETNSNNKIEEKETTVSEPKPYSKEKSISKQEDTSSKQVTIYRSNGNVVSMDLEEYLIGVVGAEMPASFQMEALKAQAVVARTYALKLLASGKKLTDTVSTQVYKDNNELKKLWGNSYSTYYQKIKEAVTSTKGVSVYYQGNYINALYHSTSNGKTEDASMVWGNSVPYLKSVDSKWDIQASSYLREIKEDFMNILNLLGISSDTNIQFEVISRDESGRVEKIKVGDKIFDGVTFRNLLKLRSTDFSINNQVSITTKGYGHGVGLSQYGANGMAQEGYTYKEILKHYYTGVEVY